MKQQKRFALLALVFLVSVLLGWHAYDLVPSSTLHAQPPPISTKLVAPYRVTVGAAAVQLTDSGNVNGGVVVKALCPGQTIYLGTSSAVTTATGYPMSDGDSIILEVRNANEVYAIASAAAQSVAVLPFYR